MKRAHLPAALAVVLSALFALASPALATTYAPATKEGPAHGLGCGAGGFPDIAGHCWTCPKGYRHDNILLPPTDAHVCKKAGGVDRRTGKKVGQSIIGICKQGWLSTNDGGCYVCPKGYGHDIAKFGNQVGVCYRKHPDAFAKAVSKGGTLVCNQGFFDPIDGGSCWSCPADAPVRTTSSVKSATACESRACGASGERPCMIVERIPSCNPGLIEDFVHNKCVPVDLKAAVCVSTLEAIKAGQQVAGFANSVNHSKQRTSTMQSRYGNKADLNRALESFARQIEPYNYVVPELKRITALLQAQRRAVETLFAPKSFCSLSTAAFDRRLAALGLAPRIPVRKAGLFQRACSSPAPTPRATSLFYMGYQVGVSGGVGIGAQLSLLWVTDFRGHGGRFMSVGPAARHQRDHRPEPDRCPVLSQGQSRQLLGLGLRLRGLGRPAE